LLSIRWQRQRLLNDRLAPGIKPPEIRAKIIRIPGVVSLSTISISNGGLGFIYFFLMDSSSVFK
ncbi:hypothetical protein, partial [Escherichia coli]|uniref:hypothetical protein n=1 Tax=Escherichia coli TaxID=562 RepID=UPI001BC8B59D